MPPLKRKLIPDKGKSKIEEKPGTSKSNVIVQDDEDDADWLSEIKDESDDEADEENYTSGSDSEIELEPIYSSNEENDSSGEDQQEQEENEDSSDNEAAEEDEDAVESFDSEDVDEEEDVEDEEGSEEEETDEESESNEEEERESNEDEEKSDDVEAESNNVDQSKNVNNSTKNNQKSVLLLKNINSNSNQIKKKKIKTENNVKSLVKIQNNKNENETTEENELNGKVTEKNSNNVDEYEYDSSDEEDIRNTVGNIPMNWYDDYPHLGYDWEGKKILKPQQSDQLDEFLKRMEDPNFWRTVKDKQTGQDVVLSDADVELIKRMQERKIPDATFEEYTPWVEWFTSEVMKMPLRKFPEHKRSFLPVLADKVRISRLVHALKMGWIKTEAQKRKEKRKEQRRKFYMLWKADNQAERMRRIADPIPAPKRSLPGHAESYNPPPEYLISKEEVKQWKNKYAELKKRDLHFMPQKFNSLREVPAYDKFITERFHRCLDLYLCPRGRKMKLLVQPDDLIPKLPHPKELEPFPTVMSMTYIGHSDMVRTIDVESKGQFLVSGSDDMTVKVWEISTGRCLKTINCGGVVRSVSWCPSSGISLILVAADRKVLLINPGVGDYLITSKTDTLLEEPPEDDAIVSERIKAVLTWDNLTPSRKEWNEGIRIIINHFKNVSHVSWHGRGDYFSCVMPEGLSRSIVIHQLSKRRSQLPFTKNKGLVQCVLFHPIKPYLFVATQQHIRIYDLVKQNLVKKLITQAKWISSMAIHPKGDNVLVGTYDRKMVWFDLDLSTKPYQTLRLHPVAVRGVAFHKRYPLFASCADDCNVIISHGMVFNDLLQNPLIVPLKRLKCHNPVNDFGIFSVKFHPIQPWLFSSGADQVIRLYS